MNGFNQMMRKLKKLEMLIWDRVQNNQRVFEFLPPSLRILRHRGEEMNFINTMERIMRLITVSNTNLVSLNEQKSNFIF